MPSNKEYSKQYYIDHKEHIKAQMKKRLITVVFCQKCNIEVTKANLYQHLKTKRHIRNAERLSMTGEEIHRQSRNEFIELIMKLENALKQYKGNDNINPEESDTLNPEESDTEANTI